MSHKNNKTESELYVWNIPKPKPTRSDHESVQPESYTLNIQEPKNHKPTRSDHESYTSNHDLTTIEDLYNAGADDILIEIFSNLMTVGKKIDSIEQKLMNIYCRVFIRNGLIDQLLEYLSSTTPRALKKIMSYISIVYWKEETPVCKDQKNLFEVILRMSKSPNIDIFEDLVEIIKFNSDFDLPLENFNIVRSLCESVWFRARMGSYLKFYSDVIGKDLDQGDILSIWRRYKLEEMPPRIVMEIYRISPNEEIENLTWFKAKDLGTNNVFKNTLRHGVKLSAMSKDEIEENCKRAIMSGEIDKLLKILDKSDYRIVLPIINEIYSKLSKKSSVPVCVDQSSFIDLFIEKCETEAGFLKLFTYCVSFDLSMRDYEKLSTSRVAEKIAPVLAFFEQKFSLGDDIELIEYINRKNLFNHLPINVIEKCSKISLANMENSSAMKFVQDVMDKYPRIIG